MKNIIYNFIILILFCPCSMWGQGKEYSFDERGISRQVLENYLERSITMVYLLMPDKPEGRRVYSYHADDMRMVKDIGAKFIGRSIYRWGACWTNLNSGVKRKHLLVNCTPMTLI